MPSTLKCYFKLPFSVHFSLPTCDAWGTAPFVCCSYQSLKTLKKRQPTFLKTTFLEICHRGEMHWVEGIQWVHMRGSQKSEKWNIKAQEGTQSMETPQ